MPAEHAPQPDLMAALEASLVNARRDQARRAVERAGVQYTGDVTDGMVELALRGRYGNTAVDAMKADGGEQWTARQRETRDDLVAAFATTEGDDA